MNERVLAKNKTSVTPPQAAQASSPLLRRPLTEEVSESVGSNSNISKELGGIQPKTIRRSLNWHAYHCRSALSGQWDVFTRRDSTPTGRITGSNGFTGFSRFSTKKPS